MQFFGLNGSLEDHKNRSSWHLLINPLLDITKEEDLVTISPEEEELGEI